MMSSADRTRRAAAVEAVAASVNAVRPIAWCTPDEVQDLGALVVNAAQRAQPLGRELHYSQRPDPKLPAALRSARRWIEEFDDGPIAAEVSAYLEAAIATVDAISSDDDDTFTRWSLSAHGTPSPATLAWAKEVLASPVAPPEPLIISAESMGQRTVEALKRQGLDDWQVQVEPRVAKMGVDHTRKLVLVREDASFSEVETQRLLVHEVGGHVLRAVNAGSQPDPSASLPFSDATATEEGLATWLEGNAAVQTSNQLRIFAARAVAVDLAGTCGISEITQALAEPLGWTDAATVAIRVKRGLRYPDRPGGYTKDHAYATGLRLVGEHLNNHLYDLDVLMATKWPLRLLPLTHSLISAGQLHRAERMPQGKTIPSET
jgi:hypothetical protein